jgi:hypothetical protein
MLYRPDKLQDVTNRPHHKFGSDVRCFAFIAMFVIYPPFLQSPKEGPVSKEAGFLQNYKWPKREVD